LPPPCAASQYGRSLISNMAASRLPYSAIRSCSKASKSNSSSISCIKCSICSFSISSTSKRLRSLVSHKEHEEGGASRSKSEACLDAPGSPRALLKTQGGVNLSRLAAYAQSAPRQGAQTKGRRAGATAGDSLRFFSSASILIQVAQGDPKERSRQGRLLETCKIKIWT